MMTYRRTLEELEYMGRAFQSPSREVMALAIAMDAVKKQIGKTPTAGCRCPSCGNTLGEKYRCCPMCGQAIFWRKDT